MPVSLSIIIVNYNTKDLLDFCLASIVQSSPLIHYEIIIVDNGSGYDVNDQIRKFKNNHKSIDIHLIQNTKNVGYGRANNQAAKRAQGDYLLFLNTDAEITDGAISMLYEYSKNQKNDCIVGPKLLNIDGTPQPSCGPYYSRAIVFAMLFLKGDKIGLTRYSPDYIKEVDWVSGACFIIKKDSFNTLNGFDEDIFMYMEEVELMYRAKQRGIRVYYYPKAQVIHKGAATSGAKKTPIINIYRGLLYIYKKHDSAFNCYLIQWMLIIKAYIGIIIGVITGNENLKTTYGEALNIAEKA